jgi:Cu(I)/Ag(I) efflux system periplasmic protein CusF
MKRLVLAAVLAAAASLAACGQKEAAPAEAAAPAAPAASGDMAGMDMAGARMAKGAGVVSAVDGDSVTIEHEPIPEANWPAMTMAFKTSPDLARSVKAGDKVSFDLKLKDGAGEITAISKQ